jgi:hypothetical protein
MASTARATGSERTRTEARPETKARAETEAGVTAVFPHVLTELFAHFATGGAALIVPGPAVSGTDERCLAGGAGERCLAGSAGEGARRSESEAGTEISAAKWAVGWSEWGVHTLCSFFRREAPCAPPMRQRYIGNYRKAIVADNETLVTPAYPLHPGREL